MIKTSEDGEGIYGHGGFQVIYRGYSRVKIEL